MFDFLEDEGIELLECGVDVMDGGDCWYIVGWVLFDIGCNVMWVCVKSMCFLLKVGDVLYV